MNKNEIHYTIPPRKVATNQYNNNVLYVKIKPYNIQV